jgi:uncharacterized membrane protein
MTHSSFLRAASAWRPLFLVFCLSWGAFSQAQSRDKSFYQEAVDSVGEMLCFLAWPSATFNRIEIKDFAFKSNGADLKLKIHATSAMLFEDKLWVELILKVRDGEFEDIRFANHNAVWAQPGETIEAWGAALEELNREYQQSQGSSGGSSFSSSSNSSNSLYDYYFTNNCGHPVELFIHYKDAGGNWRTLGWWKVAAGESTYLGSNGTRIKSANSVFYYYAKTSDGSNWVWEGDQPVSYDGRTYKMRKVTDTSGVNDWSVTCG